MPPVDLRKSLSADKESTPKADQKALAAMIVIVPRLIMPGDASARTGRLCRKALAQPASRMMPEDTAAGASTAAAVRITSEKRTTMGTSRKTLKFG